LLLRPSLATRCQRATLATKQPTYRLWQISSTASPVFQPRMPVAGAKPQLASVFVCAATQRSILCKSPVSFDGTNGNGLAAPGRQASPRFLTPDNWTLTFMLSGRLSILSVDRNSVLRTVQPRFFGECFAAQPRPSTKQTARWLPSASRLILRTTRKLGAYPVWQPTTHGTSKTSQTGGTMTTSRFANPFCASKTGVKFTTL
jgi:hypothetical protein